MRQAGRTLVPGPDDPYGILPPLLVLLTVTSGLIDAYSYLQFHRIFLANITGNVLFLGFSIGGAKEVLWWASLLGIVAFVVGALLAGRIRFFHGNHLARHLLLATLLETALLGIAVAVEIVLDRGDDRVTALLITVIGVAMGLQNATARSLSLPGLNTTVLTLSLSDMASGSSVVGGSGSNAGRRIVALLAMVCGAAVGAVLVLRAHPMWCLVTCLAILVVVIAVTTRHRATTAQWAHRER